METCTASSHHHSDRPLALVAPSAADQAPSTGTEPDTLLERPKGCGWFDSSLDLAEGLTVCEADDGPLQWALAQLLFSSRRQADPPSLALSAA